jgi:NADH dehydrogenase
VDGARRIAATAHRAGVERFVQISGIGANAASDSPYIRSRGEGEAAVRDAFPGAHVIRPAVMFGPDDAFVTVILGLLRRFHIYPMFGNGSTKLQPVHVEDVAEGIARILQPTEIGDHTFEFGGPRVYSYRELLQTIACEAGLKPLLFPVPFPAWRALAYAAERLPTLPITRNQIELMRIDTVASPQLPGLAELGISSQAIEVTVRLVARHH